MFGIIGGLLIAWLLNFIGFSDVLVQGINELFGLQISIAGYYVIFAIIGLITELLSNSFQFYNPRRTKNR